jgi:hypothetical protein
MTFCSRQWLSHSQASDGGHVTAVDWDQCVFRVEQVNFSETYHLNNIDPTRLTGFNDYPEISFMMITFLRTPAACNIPGR